jgi:hypothetical protein
MDCRVKAMDDDDKRAPAETARIRDETIKRMFATPPQPHKAQAKRRLTPSPKVRQLPKRRPKQKRAKKD